MQRSIDSFFNKVTTKKPQPVVPTKRKALVISSDEEDSPKKHSNSTPNKKPKVSKESEQVKGIDIPKKSAKSLKPADVTKFFGGEATRETKKQPKSSTPCNDISIAEETSPLKKTSKGSVPPDSPSTSKKSLGNGDNTSKKKTPNKSALSQLVDELDKSENEHDFNKEVPKKAASTENNKEIENEVSKAKTPIKIEDEDDFIPEPERKPKFSRSIKKENSSTASESAKSKSKESKQSDLESSILSDEERFERKRLSAVLYQKFKNRQSVINPNSKEVPKGKPNCFAGLSFLVTGVLESIERDEANSIIKELGGKVSSTVGKRLNYIIVGEEAGPKKMADAEALKIPILTVDDFFNLIREKSGDKVKHAKDNPETKTSKSTSTKNTPTKRKYDEIKSSPVQIKKEVKSPESKTETIVKKEVKIEVKKENKSSVKNENLEIKPETNVVFENNIAWVDKYKPTSVKQIIGQQGPASNCTKLMNWLTKWHTNQSGPKKSQKPNPWAKNDDGSYFKAALLSGPPGVGKTTTATLVCKELGYDIVEFNASDTRSKRLLKEEVSELLSNKSLHGYFCGNTQVVSKKHVLIMDEVDGMAGNEDRGGIQELISLIKDAHVPIICMCNDRNHQKMRSLVNYCYDLRFNRPRLEQIKGFIRSICFKEKIKMSPEKIDEIIQATNNDIRQSVNHICLLSSGEDIELKTKSAKTAQKDLKMGPWEVVRKVFSAEDHKTMSLADKSDLFFHDYSMAPLFVQQNYLMVSPTGPKSDVLKKVALTADSLSLGDLVDRRIRSNSAWTLLPVQAVLSSVLPGDYMEGHFTGQINFPGWLGKYSRSNKRSRLAQELHDHTRIRTSGSRLSIRMDYAPFLLSNIVRPLKDRGLEGVEESLKVLQEYRLLREDIDSLIELTTWPGKKSLMDAVDGRVKAALTRSYNKEILPYSYSAVTTVKKKKIDNNEGDDLMGIMESEEGEAAVVVESEEEDNSLDNDNLIKAKKKPTPSTSKTSSKASSSKKASASAKPKAAAKSKK